MRAGSRRPSRPAVGGHRATVAIVLGGFQQGQRGEQRVAGETLLRQHREHFQLQALALCLAIHAPADARDDALARLGAEFFRGAVAEHHAGRPVGLRQAGQQRVAGGAGNHLDAQGGLAAAAEVGGGGDLPGARHGEGDVRACGQGGDVLGTVAGAADRNDLAHRRRALQPLGEGADQAVLEAEQHQQRVITAARAKIAQSDRRASPR